MLLSSTNPVLKYNDESHYQLEADSELPRECYSHYIATNSQCHTACCVPGEFPSVKAAREASMLEFLNRRQNRKRVSPDIFDAFEWKIVHGMIRDGKMSEVVHNLPKKNPLDTRH